MGLIAHWVGEEEIDRVAETRLRCYAPAAKDMEHFKDRARNDPYINSGDFLLVERDGRAVGTVTSYSLTMWVRGAPIPCQGVAWVGTIKTERRKSGANSAAAGPGVATVVMNEVLRKGRERGEMISALMPFRNSYYEHFGYGIVERRCDWTLPISVLPTGSFEGLRFYEPDDLEFLADCRQRIVQAGQCDIQRTDRMWQTYLKKAEDGFTIVDRPAEGGAARGWLTFLHQKESGKDLIRITDMGFDSPAAMMRQLYFLASLRDQFSTVILTLPADLPLNRLLKETQIPHRPVNHLTAEVRPYTRMQARVLDHKKLIELMHFPPEIRGQAAVRVRESEGHVSSFSMEFNGGRASVTPLQREQKGCLQCGDKLWASIIFGELPATRAAALGLIEAGDHKALALLDAALSIGPLPFSREFF